MTDVVRDTNPDPLTPAEIEKFKSATLMQQFSDYRTKEYETAVATILRLAPFAAKQIAVERVRREKAETALREIVKLTTPTGVIKSAGIPLGIRLFRMARAVLAGEGDEQR